MIQSNQLEALKLICANAQVVSEAGMDYIVLPKLKVVTDTSERVLTGLLCPTQQGGYSTRLFLSEPIPERGQNWTSHYILGQNWHVWSWNGVLASLTLAQILSAHLKALR
jgi:hypothetical protein